MKSIGPTVKDARRKRGLTREEVSVQTKIKEQFIAAIENEKWDLLPDYPVVLGFVRNISKALSFDEERMAAILRRDYPPKKIFVNPKPEMKEEFVWGPKLTFFLGSIVILLVIGGYLAYQYLNFMAPPAVEITVPKENEEVKAGLIKVMGKTEEDASVSVNNQPALITDGGEFQTELEVNKDVTELVIIAKTRSGKETIVKRSIVVESEK